MIHYLIVPLQDPHSFTPAAGSVLDWQLSLESLVRNCIALAEEQPLPKSHRLPRGRGLPMTGLFQSINTGPLPQFKMIRKDSPRSRALVCETVWDFCCGCITFQLFPLPSSASFTLTEVLMLRSSLINFFAFKPWFQNLFPWGISICNILGSHFYNKDWQLEKPNF